MFIKHTFQKLITNNESQLSHLLHQQPQQDEAVERSLVERIDELTTISVARGVGFSGLLIISLMSGFAGEAINLLRTAGFGALTIAIVLFIKSLTALVSTSGRTEVSSMLMQSGFPLLENADTFIFEARRKIFLHWAMGAAFVALVFFWIATYLATFEY
jgi:hypothetical protein